MKKSNSFFDSMIIVSGGKSCRASDLYTKKDPFRKTPQSWRDLSEEEKRRTKDAAITGREYDRTN